MRRFKNWLICKLLPTWAREARDAEIAKLKEENERLKRRVELLNSYIDGMEAGLKAQRRIIINTGKDGKA